MTSTSAAQFGKVKIEYANALKRTREFRLIEVRIPARTGKTPNVYERSYLVRPKNFIKLLEGSSGMAHRPYLCCNVMTSC